ncbi:MAG: hypothetical protein V4773_20505 [Verrucomicrobiota bacterium]
MSSRVRVWRSGALLVLLAAAVGGVWSQRYVTEELRHELARAKEAQADGKRQQVENARLAAGQQSAEELERLRSDRVALQRLRAEVEALKTSFKKAPAAPAQNTTKGVEGAGTFADGRTAKAEEWKNVGRATPVAAFETALWAAAAGDVDALAAGIMTDVTTRPEVDRLWGQLSPAERLQYGSPERLLAALTLKDIPLGTAQVSHTQVLKPGEYGFTEETASVVAVVIDADKKRRPLGLFLRRAGDEWRLLLPASAVRKYREQLTAK